MPSSFFPQAKKKKRGTKQSLPLVIFSASEKEEARNEAIQK
jgi:hypothetical protein